MTRPTSRVARLLLAVVGVLLTGCTLASPRGATIAPARQTDAVAAGATDCPPAAVAGTAPGLDAAQQANAKVIVGVALTRGLGAAGAAIGVAAALAESSLYNYANDGTSTLVGSAEHRQLDDTERAVARQSLKYPHDKVGNNLDSIGLFQQRPMTGWGTPAELINSATAAGKFFDQMVKVPNWQTQSPWTVAQTVQGSPSSDGGIYRDSYQQAFTIVTSLTPTVGNVAPGSVIAQQAGGSPAVAAKGQSGAVILASATLNCGAGASVRPAWASAGGGGGSAAWGGYANGRIPASALCPVPSAPTLQLECGAAHAFDELNTAFAAQVGQNIGISDGYRSYDAQVACRLEKGSLCADPGTSNHGWGKAVDIGGCCDVNTGTGPAFDWLTANAGRYGWTHPDWAQPTGSKPEPWHWEYGNIS